MRFLAVHLPDVAATAVAMALVWYIATRLSRQRAMRLTIQSIGWTILFVGLLLRSATIASMLPLPVADTLRITAFLTLVLVCATALIIVAYRFVPTPAPHHSPGRRLFLETTRTAVMASPLIATGYGVFIQRDNFRVREVKVRIPRLSKQLDGLRIVQLSDIHLSPFLSERELARTIDMANETKAHVAVVTGDLITGYRDPLDACIQQIGRLRADAGVIGCLGNHETYARVERYTTEQAARVGVRFLRGESKVLEFGGSPINFAGVDYQPMHSDYLEDAGELVQLGMPNVLLSHNPDVFPIARQKGFDLTLSGHTHGGQITFEVLHQNVSIARFYTPYVYGLYEADGASAYVTRGIGTVGVPARLGAPPEVSLIRLCAI